jgi:hypothetical protein
MPGPMPQQEFLAKIRAEVPELKDFPDAEVINGVLKRRPDLIDKIENPMAGDAVAAKAQQDAQNKSQQAGTFQPFMYTHPKIKALTKGALDTLPAIGGIGAGIFAAPETLGLGSPMAVALGTGVGTGARDLLAQGIGVEPYSSPISKGVNIAEDSLLSKAVPDLIEAGKTPIKSLGGFVEYLQRFEPKFAQKYLNPQIIDDFTNWAKSETPKPKVTPVVSNFQTDPKVTVTDMGNVTSGQKLDPARVQKLLPSKIDPEPKLKTPNPQPSEPNPKLVTYSDESGKPTVVAGFKTNSEGSPTSPISLSTKNPSKSTVTQKLKMQSSNLEDTLKAHEEANQATQRLVAPERFRRFKSISEQPVNSVEDAKKVVGQLKGEYPKGTPSTQIDFTGDRDELMKTIWNHPELSIYEKPRLLIALGKLFGDSGDNLQSNEIELIRKTFDQSK